MKFFHVWRWKGPLHRARAANDPTIAFVPDLNDNLKEYGKAKNLS